MSDLAALFPFSKWNGAGNDFILFYLRTLPKALSQLWISQICHRQFGIGADGVIICGTANATNRWMRIFNRDGSCPDMCGNALRCAALFFALQSPALKERSFPISLLKNTHEVFIQKDGQPCVQIQSPDICQNVTLKVQERNFKGLLVDTGVPHFVVAISSEFGENLAQFPLALWGPKLRNHVDWANYGVSEGVNVTFVDKIKTQYLRIRTFERGVEAETLACGTGAAAAGWVYGDLKPDSAPCTVEFTSRVKVQIHLTNTKSKAHLWQTGPVQRTFTGQIELPNELFCELSRSKRPP